MANDKVNEASILLFNGLRRELQKLSIWDLSKLKGVETFRDLPDKIQGCLYRIATDVLESQR